jgi:hypothetical protein
MHVHGYSTLARRFESNYYKRLLIMVTFLEYAFDCSVLLWHDEVGSMVISDLRQACTIEQTCASISYDAIISLINGQPRSISGQITHCNHQVVV